MASPDTIMQPLKGGGQDPVPPLAYASGEEVSDKLTTSHVVSCRCNVNRTEAVCSDPASLPDRS